VSQDKVFFVFAAPLILKVTGRDARRYLNSRLSADIKSLAPGNGVLAGALTAQGRTQGVFCILNIAQDDFLVYADGERAADVLAALKAFVVADRIDFQLCDNLTLMHIITGGNDNLSSVGVGFAALPVGNFNFVRAGESVLVNRKRAEAGGFDLILEREKLATIRALLKGKGFKELSQEEIKLLRFRAGIPAFPEEINEDHLFPEAGLEGSISYTKGCYIGQEVLEKLDARGKLPKILLRVGLSGMHDFSDQLSRVVRGEGGEKLGEVLSFAQDGEREITYCFVSVKNSAKPFEKLLICGKLVLDL